MKCAGDERKETLVEANDVHCMHRLIALIADGRVERESLLSAQSLAQFNPNVREINITRLLGHKWIEAIWPTLESPVSYGLTDTGTLVYNLMLIGHPPTIVDEILDDAAKLRKEDE